MSQERPDDKNAPSIALRWLVDLKAIKDALDDHAAGVKLLGEEWFAMNERYRKEKPAAWKAAREALGGENKVCMRPCNGPGGNLDCDFPTCMHAAPVSHVGTPQEEPRRWADQYDFDKSDPATRLFVAASNWMDRAHHAEKQIEQWKSWAKWADEEYKKATGWYLPKEQKS